MDEGNVIEYKADFKWNCEEKNDSVSWLISIENFDIDSKFIFTELYIEVIINICCIHKD